MTAVIIILVLLAMFLMSVLAYFWNRITDFEKHVSKYISDRQCDVLSNPTIDAGRDRYDELGITGVKINEYIRHAKAMPWKHGD